MTEKAAKTTGRKPFPGQGVVGTARPPAVSLKKGETVSGSIYNAEPYQVTDFETREPLEWPDGSPQMGLAIMFNNEETGAKTTLYVQGQERRRNYGAALAAAGIDPEEGVAAGDYISITYTANKKTKKGGIAKVYEIVIKPV